jgi:hypothetical protein
VLRPRALTLFVNLNGGRLARVGSLLLILGVKVSIVAKRMAIVFGSLSLIVGISFVAAAIVEYKPWGVPDLRRQEYEQILTKINKRALLEGTSKPDMKVISIRNPEGIQQPGDLVTTTATVRNRGALELRLDVKSELPYGFTPQQPLPINIAPGTDHAISFDWKVPNEQPEEGQLSVKLRSNDPLNEELLIEPTCNVAKSFFVANEEMADTKLSSEKLVIVNHVFSQRYDVFILDDFNVDSRIHIETEPEFDDSVLKQHKAMSGVKVKATYPAGSKPSKQLFPIKFKAMNDVNSEELEFTFYAVIKSPVAFYGPDLDTRTGYRLGVIKIGSEKSWNLFARIKGDKLVSDMAAEVSPDGLEATISRARADANDFRITLRLKADAKPVAFQGDKQGYVKVFSQSDPSIANWLPLSGVIIEPAKNQR